MARTRRKDVTTHQCLQSILTTTPTSSVPRCHMYGRIKFGNSPRWGRNGGLYLSPSKSHLKCVLYNKTGTWQLDVILKKRKGAKKADESPTKKVCSLDNFTPASPCQSAFVPEMKLSMDTFRSKLVVMLPLLGRQELKSQPRTISMVSTEIKKKTLEYWR